MQTIEAALPTADHMRYAKAIEVSKRIRWDTERDVIRDRTFDFAKKFLPDGLSLAHTLDFLNNGNKRLVSQIQGRTYANMFALVERFIGAKMLEITRAHWFGDQVALEALVRLSDEELKHQAMFRTIESMIAEHMPPGYVFSPEPNAVAAQVMAASTWAVLALTCHIELFSQVHYRESLAPDGELSELFKDVFLFHWKEESQHAILDELEWKREHARLSEAERDNAVDDLIALVGAVNGIVVQQAQMDVRYFFAIAEVEFNVDERKRIADCFLTAYRWQYIVSGLKDARFATLLASMLTPTQSARIQHMLQPLLSN
jgi:hypothetical protein